MRVPKKIIRETIKLLEECQSDRHYPKEILEYAYDHGFVITDYSAILEKNGISYEQIDAGEDKFIRGLNEIKTLACIAFIFRRDHFCEGALDECIANGLLLKYYRRLMDIATAQLKRRKEGNVCTICGSVHTAPILWGLPTFNEEMVKQINNEELYTGGCCVTVHDPTHHCFDCGEDFTPGEEILTPPVLKEPYRLYRDQILNANRIFYNYNMTAIFIELKEDDEEIYCCSKEDTHWWGRKADNFWWAWDMDPMMYPPLSGKEAAAIIAEWEGHPEGPVIDQGKLTKAIAFAVERHDGQLRKGTQTPYITHPMETMCILSAMKADTDLLIAGLLHDTIEDTETTRAEIANLFGEDVAELVDGHSEDKSRTWDERKTTAIEKLKDASIRLKMLIMADKVSNLRCMCRDYCAVGEELWNRFNTPAEKQAWYYGSIQDALEDMQDVPEAAPVYWEMVGLYKDLFVAYYVSSGKLYQVCRSGESYWLKQGNPTWTPIEGSVPKKAERISRYKAEVLEDIWNEPFYETIKTDLKKGNYEVFHSATRILTIDVTNGCMTLHGEDYDAGCSTVNSKDDCEFFYSLKAEDTEALLHYLRNKHGIRLKLSTILKKEFGTSNGSTLFRECCQELGISWGFFAT